MLENFLNAIWESVPGPILWGIALMFHISVVWYGLKFRSRTPQD
jgi:hypothetical protein